MKNSKKRPIDLKKVVIARIDSQSMKRIKGGDCIPTQHINTIFECIETTFPD